MRLQLTVLRHTLPPVKVLFPVNGTTQALPNGTAAGLTIAQLLEQVNEVIPLESDTWGADDYAVEVHGFECLHYSQLGQILKDDDEVCIRPLQTSDIRQRKISGRHQITSDGRHLIDGVAFGRPLPRRIDRPAINIPPRKRKRIAYFEQADEDVDELSDDYQAVVAGFYDDNNASAEDNEEADEDYIAADNEAEDLAAELQDIHNDLHDMVAKDGGGPSDVTNAAKDSETADQTSRRVTRSHRLVEGLGLQGPDFLKLIDENGRPYPGAYNNPLLDFYAQEGSSSGQGAPQKKRRKLRGIIDVPPDPLPRSRRESSASIKNVRFQDDSLETPPTTVLEPEDSEDTEDDDFEPPDELDYGMNESDKENTKPRAGSISSEIMSSQSESSSSSSSDSGSASDTSSSGSSSSSSSDPGSAIDESAEHSMSMPFDPGPKSSSVSSSSSSSSSSDDDNEAPSTKESTVSPAAAASSDKAQETPKRVNQAAYSPHPKVSISPNLSVTPGQGKSATQRRNARRKLQVVLKRAKESGELPANASIADILERRHPAREPAPETANQIEANSDVDIVVNGDFEVRRQALLDSIASGGVDAGESLTDHERTADGVPSQPPVEEPSSAQAVEPPKKSSSQVEGMHMATDQVVTAQEQSSSGKQPASGQLPVALTKPRAKLDLASTRRMLFGALGQRTPKTKEDETALQTKLMKDIRPVKKVVLDEAMAQEPAPQEATPEDGHKIHENWWERIDLRAVECCQEGVELSTPPFPFVQRWDPQQQRGYSAGNRNKGGRNNHKKRKRNNQQYYDNGFDEKGAAPASKRAKSLSPRDLDTHDHIMPESQANVVDSTNYDDLPALPRDLTVYANLTKRSAVPGTVIAFKKLDMSQETNWQPRVSEYKTALIDAISDDGTLQMTLAHRDRFIEETHYDPESGARLYNKFEMPGYDEDAASGHIEIILEELIEPKIVRPGAAIERASSVHTSNEEDENLQQIADELPDKQTIQDAAEECPEDETAQHQDNLSPVEETAEVSKIQSSQDYEERADESWEGIEDTVAEGTETENTADLAQDTEIEVPLSGSSDHEYDPVTYPDLSTENDKSAAIEDGSATDHDTASHQAIETNSASDQLNEQRTKDPSEEVREEISKLIREAGWRSSLNPEVRGEEVLQSSQPSPKQNDLEVEVHVRSSNPPSPYSNGFNSDTIAHLEGAAEQRPSEIAETVQEAEEVIPDSHPEPGLPKRSQEPSLDGNGSDDNPTAMDEDSALWDTQANQQIESEEFSSRTSTPKASKLKPTSRSHLSTRNVKSISPPALTKSKVSPRISSTAPELKNKANGKAHNEKETTDNASSSDETPSLEKVFAKRIAALDHPSSSIPPQSSQHVPLEIKDEDPEFDISALPSHSQSSSNTQKQHTQKRPFRSTPINESTSQSISDGEIGFVFGSQVPENSQIIDLTLSSDPIEPDESAYEGDSSLPTGPGWMQKVVRRSRKV